MTAQIYGSTRPGVLGLGGLWPGFLNSEMELLFVSISQRHGTWAQSAAALPKPREPSCVCLLSASCSALACTRGSLPRVAASLELWRVSSPLEGPRPWPQPQPQPPGGSRLATVPGLPRLPPLTGGFRCSCFTAGPVARAGGCANLREDPTPHVTEASSVSGAFSLPQK